MRHDLKIDIADFTDKASKEERFLSLYENYDYITAYSKHTDIRVKDDPKWSIGRGDEWESHGDLQLRFLKEHGLKPESRFLDIGCGIGRAARKIVPYLNIGNYTGMDISEQAIDYAKKLSIGEGWISKRPEFVISNGSSVPKGQYDIIWAHSVFTHLPEQIIRDMMYSIKSVMAKNGKFLFTYKKGKDKERTGLKQFRYPFYFFEDLAKEIGLQAKPINMLFPATQHTAKVLWGATGVVER